MEKIIESIVTEFLKTHDPSEIKRTLFEVWDGFMASEIFNEMDGVARANALFGIRGIVEFVSALETAKRPVGVLD